MKTKIFKTSFLNGHYRWAIAILLTAFTLAACDKWLDDDDENDEDGANIGAVYADHLDTPWEMAFAPDGRMFITQRPGTITVVENGNEKLWVAVDSAEEVGESGLLGIAVDPEFNQNGYVYVGYTYAASKGPLKLVNRLVRYKENPATKTGVFDKKLMDGIEGNFIHNSGPIEFGPDGMLYWAIGDRYIANLAQDMNVLNGKILRMTRDGAIPSDNPFPNSYIYSLGHRNPQGLAFQPGTNILWSTEHGPSEEQGCCRDEINRILPGRNYGWPHIMGGQQKAGLEMPVYHSGDTATWAPTGGVFLKQGDWQGSMLFTGLRGQALYRVIFNADDPSKIDKVERYLHKKLGRLRNVTEGSDGRIYIAVSNHDGRGDLLSRDDRVIRMTPKELSKYKSDDVGQSNSQ